MPIVRDYQGKNDVLTIRRENGDGLNQEKALVEDGADHDCGEALLESCDGTGTVAFSQHGRGTWSSHCRLGSI